VSAQHTPGPWRIGKTFSFHRRACIPIQRTEFPHLTIAAVMSEGQDVDLHPAHVADACLLAAAPDLLDMARKALAAWTGEGPPIDLDSLRAAIAKSEGRS
jgi:hypothetical protein